MYNWSPERKREIENRVEVLFEVIVTKNFPKFPKVIAVKISIHKFKKLCTP